MDNQKSFILCSINGDVRSGKTTLATALALTSKKPNIYANFKIDDPRAKVIEPDDLWNVHDSIILVDEIYEWIDARTSGKHINRYISQLLFKRGKRNNDVIVISQLFSVEDKRIRDLSQLIIMAENKGDRLKYTILINSQTSPRIKKVSIPINLLEPIWNKFDTLEDHEIPYDLIGDAILDKRKILPEVKRIANELLLISDSKWTLSAVRSHVLDNGYPKSYAQAIYDEIQRKKVGE